jgi:hypothetical protein
MDPRSGNERPPAMLAGVFVSAVFAVYIGVCCSP